MITVTEAAVEQIRKNLIKRGSGLGIRLAVKPTGCSGYAYQMEFVDESATGDQIIIQDNISIFVDPKSAIFLSGTEIDFEINGLNSGFKFTNPLEKDRCGCGESFRV